MNLNRSKMAGIGLAVVVGLTTLAACGGDDERTAPVTSTTAAADGPSTTTPPATPTTVDGTATTVRRTATTTAAAEPGSQPVDGMPQVTLTPSHGEPGESIAVEGSGFVDPQWKQSPASVWLAGSLPNCAVYAQAKHNFVVSAAGLLTGVFVVPAQGECRQSDLTEAVLTAGSYRLVFQCTACTIGQFELTGPAACGDVIFGPGGDAAGSITALGLSCGDAEAFVRRVGGSMGAENGLSTIEAEGFNCRRVSQEDVGLPSSTYDCVNGAKRITLVRT